LSKGGRERRILRARPLRNAIGRGDQRMVRQAHYERLSTPLILSLSKDERDMLGIQAKEH